MFNFIKEYIKINIATIMEYRQSFILQSIGMFVNDLAWVVIWWIIFNNFKTIGGWQFKDMLLLYSIISITWGLTGFFFGNLHRITDVIIKGKLDFYLTLPKPVLLHILISRGGFSGLGDFVFGLAILPFAGLSFVQVPLFIIFCICSAFIISSVLILIGSLTFFIGGRGEFQEIMKWSMFVFATYPIGVFKGLLKLMLLTIIPAGLLASVPVDLIRNFDLPFTLYIIFFTVIIFTLANLFFKFGLKRYESGNLINVRV